MESYNHYSIVCISCGRPLNHLADNYLALVESTGSIRSALDKLGLFLECCRQTMMNPHVIFFDMENKDKILGKDLGPEVVAVSLAPKNPATGSVSSLINKVISNTPGLTTVRPPTAIARTTKVAPNILAAVIPEETRPTLEPVPLQQATGVFVAPEVIGIPTLNTPSLESGYRNKIVPTGCKGKDTMEYTGLTYLAR